MENKEILKNLQKMLECSKRVMNISSNEYKEVEKTVKILSEYVEDSTFKNESDGGKKI